MITQDNYFEKVKEIDHKKLSEELQKEYQFAKKVTNNHTRWKYYDQDKDIRTFLNRYFKKLNDFLQSEKVLAGRVRLNKKAAPAKGSNKTKVKGDPEEKEIPERKSRPIEQPELVERMSEEIKFIKRFVVMQGKKKTDVQLLSFINALQKAILERRIRKHSLYAQEIKYIQTALVNAYNKLLKVQPHRRIVTIKINDHVFNLLKEIGNSQKALLSVNYLKRYIGIQGKRLTKDKVERLQELLEKAAKSRKLLANDPYADRLKTVYNSLTQFLKVGKRTDTLEVHPGILNGINEALEGCDCCDEKKKPLS